MILEEKIETKSKAQEADNGVNMTLKSNKYLYNGKELQDDMLGTVNLDWYDYGARFYDPAIGRFTTQDPLADEFNSWTPYHYVHNNPIMLIDPTGMSADWFENELTGEVMNVKGESTLPATEEAKGYVHLGEDDMFGEENIPEGQEGTVTRMSAEESQEFMAEQGYEFKPKESYEAIRNDNPVSTITPGGTTVSVINKSGERIIAARTYAKQEFSQQKKVTVFATDQHPGSSYTNYSKTQYSYKGTSNSSFLKFIGKTASAGKGDASAGGNNINTVYSWEDITNPKLLKLKGK